MRRSAMMDGASPLKWWDMNEARALIHHMFPKCPIRVDVGGADRWHLFWGGLPNYEVLWSTATTVVETASWVTSDRQVRSLSDAIVGDIIRECDQDLVLRSTSYLGEEGGRIKVDIVIDQLRKVRLSQHLLKVREGHTFILSIPGNGIPPGTDKRLLDSIRAFREQLFDRTPYIRRTYSYVGLDEREHQPI